MADIKYTIAVDGSGLRTDAYFAQMLRDSQGPIDDILRRYDDLQEGERLIKDELENRYQSERRHIEASLGRHKQVEQRQLSLSDKYRQLNRSAQLWMQTGTAAAAAVAGGLKLAIDAANRFDAQFSVLNHSTAGLSREWRKLRQDFDAGMAAGVGASDGMIAGGIGLVRGYFNTVTDVWATIFRSVGNLQSPGSAWEEQQAANYYRRADVAAARDAAAYNAAARVERMYQADVLAAQGDDIGAFEMRGRQGLKDLAVERTGALVRGEITDQEYVATVDGAKAAFEAQLQAMRDAKALRQQELHAEAIVEAADEFDAMVALLEDVADEWAGMVRDQRERMEREADAFKSLNAAISMAELDAQVESDRATEMRLRQMGMDREADELRIRSAYGADRRRLQMTYGGLIDRALTDPLADNDRQGFLFRAQDTLNSLLGSLDKQMEAELAALTQPQKSRAGLDVGQGLGVGGNATVYSGRVFGHVRPEREMQTQTEKLKSIEGVLKRIERNTQRSPAAVYGR